MPISQKWLIQSGHLQPDETNLDVNSKCRHQRATGENKWLNERICPLSLERRHVHWLSQFKFPVYWSPDTNQSLALFAFRSLLLGLRIVVLFG